MAYIKASLSLKDLNELLDNNPELIKTSRAGLMYVPLNIDISRFTTIYGNNVTLRVYQGRNTDRSIEKGPILGYGQVDIETLKNDLNEFVKP